MTESAAPEPVRIDGFCPFLTCLQDGPHTHEVCATCGAVRHGNCFYCPECNTVTNAIWAANGWDPTVPYFGGDV